MNDNNKGLYGKYRIKKADGTPVTGFKFVLSPEKDPASLEALKTYANVTNNTKLAEDLITLIENLEKRPTCDYCDEQVDKVRPTPFLADLSASMCKECWDMTKKEYMESHGEYIPEFEDYSGFKKENHEEDDHHDNHVATNPDLYFKE